MTNPESALPTDGKNHFPWHTDESLRRAGCLLEKCPGLRAISFDFFDTLVWRLAARPTDVFAEVGHRLRQDGALRGHVSDLDFEVLRRHAEATARERQSVHDKSREDITLAEIVEQLKPVVPEADTAAQTELAVEGDFCLLNPQMIEFARHARQRGLKLFIISDIYLSADQLRGILHANHFDPAFFDGIFTSSDAGVCKWSGKLFPHVLKQIGFKPEELLHVGDNFHADVAGARKAGVRGCHYVQGTNETSAILERERFLLGSRSPMGSVNSLRLLAARNFPGGTDEDFFGRAGAMLLGPLLTRYASWACEQFVAAGVRKVGAFMREGEILGQLLQREAAAMGHPLEIAPLYVNRKSTDLAAIGKLTAENLIDWVGRRQTLRVKAILEHFGLRPSDVRQLPFSPDEKISSRERLLQFAKFLFVPEIMKRIEQRSAAERRKVMDYLRPWLDGGGSLGVCDIGYNATAQMQLKRIFALEGGRTAMTGCYLVTSEMAAHRVLDGLDVRHFLGAFGQPGFNHFAFLRSPAFVEQSLVAACGTTLGYERDADGTVRPVLDEMRFPPELLRRQRAFKDGVLHYQKLWLHFREQKPGLLDGTTDFSRRLLADIDVGCTPILARASAFPTQNELARFGSLPLDDYYFAEGFKTISGAKERDFVRAKGYAAALGDQGVLWPQAANLQLNPKAGADFFSYARAMLLCQPSHDYNGVQPALTVILRADNSEKLRAVLGQLANNFRAESGCEIFLLLKENDKACAAIATEFACGIHRLHVFQRTSSQSALQQLNLAADNASAPLLLLLDDSAQLADAWDQAAVASFQADTGAVLVTPDASCLIVRRLALVEALGFAEELSPVGANWRLLLALRKLGWQIKSSRDIVTSSLPQNISSADLKSLARRFPDFETTTAEIAAEYSLPTATVPKNNEPPTRLVSIIILVLNQLEHTRTCLESIAAHTTLPHEIILVDNGSTDGTPDFLKKWQAGHSNGTVIRNDSNRGFAGGNNQGLAVARGEFVLLLNNDTAVTAGWLEAMLAVLARHPDAGLVGPMSNRVSGPQLIREAAYKNLSEMHAFAGKFVQTNAGQSFEVVRAVGFCLLARREVIAQIGGLDEKFGSGNFEDDDFCLRAQFAGFRIRIARDAFVHHTGSQTFAGEKIDYRLSMRRNWDIFRAKWELPAEATLEHGYPLPKHLPHHLDLNIPLPTLTATHHQDGNRWTEKNTRPTAAPVKPAAVAEIGRLDEARELFGQKSYPAAWAAATAAVARRPFHPEALLLLAEIALASGDVKSAKLLAQRARTFARGWSPAKQFLKKADSGKRIAENSALASIIAADVSRITHHALRLSVCLIVKNEGQFLAQCLKSVREFASQIVVVDTGSTDRTVEIAREFGAEIHAFAWCDDFAAARNAALEHATGDWILMLDADEELPAAQHAKLLADTKNPAVIAFRLPLVNAGQENEGRSFIPRLFRNAPGVFFHGRIHEQVFSSLLVHAKSWGLQTALGTAEILHHGYTQEMVRDRNKIKRNLKLLRAAVAENPADVNLVMNLGLELVRSDDLPGGLEKYRAAFEMMSAQPQAEVVPELREVLLTQFTSQLYKVRDHAEVVEVLNSPLAQRGGLTASLHFALGLAHFELKQFSEAADQMRQCLARRRQPGLTPINTDILTAAPSHCLALSLAKLGDVAGAEKSFQAALAEPGTTEAARLDYAAFLQEQNRPVDALHQLNEIVAHNARHLAAWRLGGEIALGRAEFSEFARDWTGEAFKALPENPVIAAQRAEALILNGDTAAAAGLWEKIWSSEPEPGTLAALILCEAIEAQTTHAPDEGADEAATSRAFVAWYQKLIARRAQPVIGKINGQLDKLSRALPTAARMLETALAEAEVPAEV